nr:MAG TPA: hypothetical protein [Caudoviricetes sp.]
MRGEYPPAVSRKFRVLELPPRARRIHIVPFRISDLNGTTSACAENTWR